MDDMTTNARDGNLIRVTAEDLADPHVDDLLKRQASLRGERGITANRQRKWYYRNWFVFMIAGGLAALAAWAIIEPHFDDVPYVQGKIENFDTDGYPKSSIPQRGGGLVVQGMELTGCVKVNGEQFYLASVTRDVEGGRMKSSVDPAALELGQEVGLGVTPIIDGGPKAERGFPADPAWIVTFVDFSPPPRARPTPPLSQILAMHAAQNLLLFPLVAALVGVGIGTVDGMVCRLWRRVLLAGVVGLLIGFIGGFVSGIVANFAFAPLALLAQSQSAEHGGIGGMTVLGFLTLLTGRSLAWCLAGMTMGLGQGIVLRSSRLLLYGFLGGAIGGLLGGLLFDPVYFLVVGEDAISAHWSRAVGIVAVGATVGVMIGIVELLARDAWLNMVQGPLAGKEFLIFKDLIYVGASPRSDIYLFNDADVAQRHAVIRAVADHYEIEATDQSRPLLVNGRPVQRQRLRHGDQITLGRTVFSFQRRRMD